MNRRDLEFLFDATEALQIHRRKDLMDQIFVLGMERLSIKAARKNAKLLAEMRRDGSVIDAIRRRRKHYLGPRSKSVWELLEEKTEKSKGRFPGKADVSRKRHKSTRSTSKRGD